MMALCLEALFSLLYGYACVIGEPGLLFMLSPICDGTVFRSVVFSFIWLCLCNRRTRSFVHVESYM